MLSRPRPPSKPIRRAVRKREDVSGGLRHLALRLIQPLTSSPLSSLPYPPPTAPSSRLLALHADSSKSIYSLCLSPTPAFCPRLFSFLLSPVETNKGAGNPAANASLLDGSATEAALFSVARRLQLSVCVCVRLGKALHFLSFPFVLH